MFVFKISPFLEEQNMEIPPFNEQSLVLMLILLMLIKFCFAFKKKKIHLHISLSKESVLELIISVEKQGGRKSYWRLLDQTCCSDSIKFTKSNLN